MALLTAQVARLSGPAITYAAAAGGGDTFVIPTDHTELRVKNGGGSPITVTLTVPGNTDYGVANPVLTFTVAAGAEAACGPLPIARLTNPTTGVVNVGYSAVTSVTVAVVVV